MLVLTVLSIILAACFWYCFSRAAAWSPTETPAPSPIFDYVLYLGSLVWGVELAYVENRLHVPLGGLGPDEVASLASALRPESLDDEVVRRLHKDTGGHPLYLQTLLNESSGFDPRGPESIYRWFRISPRRIQAWREVNELKGRELMRDGRWIV